MCSSASFGLGSNVSRWLGPPSMNRKMHAFALAGKCGFFGASGLSARAAGTDASAANSGLSRSRYARASAPKPPPPRSRKSRREDGRSTWGSWEAGRSEGMAGSLGGSPGILAGRGGGCHEGLLLPRLLLRRRQDRELRLPGEVDRLGQDAGHFLWRVEA